ncbi:hypothetical protein P7M11_10500 [Bisgaard Taxon 10/6]|uniref:hypothetical protein n=1 Tax=Exercitatus varius TaxID=67857 RepID=UPI00294AFCDE|nr:hypothetical protein [Exercitatus varius]MDG2955140.1 hypothetical protein [Exercitatus varius]
MMNLKLGAVLDQPLLMCLQQINYLKILIYVLAIATFSINVVASSNLEQVKLDTLTKIYHKSGINNPYGHLEKYVTPDFKKVITKAKKHDKSEEDFDSLCLGGYCLI